MLAEIYGGDGEEGRARPFPPAADRRQPRTTCAPLVGVAPPGGRHLALYAVDIGRGPDGALVGALRPHPGAPRAPGYALRETAIVLSRVYPALMERLRVERLAPFFLRAFRDGLSAVAERAQPRIGLLTPGPFSETYFEQATLARYLWPAAGGGGTTTSSPATARCSCARSPGSSASTCSGGASTGINCDPLALAGRLAARRARPRRGPCARAGSSSRTCRAPAAVEQRALNGLHRGAVPAPAGRGPEPAQHRDLVVRARPALREEALARMDTLAFGDAFGWGALRARVGTRCGRPRGARGAHRRGGASTSSARTWCACRRRRSGAAGALVPRPFVLARLRRRDARRLERDARRLRAHRRQPGMHVRSRWGRGRCPPTSGCSPTGRWRASRSFPSRASGACSAHLPSRAADNLFWLGRYLRARRDRHAPRRGARGRSGSTAAGSVTRRRRASRA